VKKPVVVNENTIAPLPAPAAMPQVAGSPVAMTRLGPAAIPAGENAIAGIWECTPGVFRRQIAKREFSHFIAGHCFFTPDGGDPIEIRAGDAAYFPANCNGVWDVREAVRKSYVIVD
jgi:uncharacterized protein